MEESRSQSLSNNSDLRRASRRSTRLQKIAAELKNDTRDVNKQTQKNSLNSPANNVTISKHSPKNLTLFESYTNLEDFFNESDLFGNYVNHSAIGATKEDFIKPSGSRSAVRSYANKKSFEVHRNETFGLPDKSIFTESGSIIKPSELDAEIESGSAVTLLCPEYINEPWLVSSLESDFFTYSTDIRYKTKEIAYKFKKKLKNLSSFNFSMEEDNDIVNMNLNASPVDEEPSRKISEECVSVISTIKIVKKEVPSELNILALTNNIRQMIENAIKSESAGTLLDGAIGNIDMKIEIVNTKKIQNDDASTNQNNHGCGSRSSKKTFSSLQDHTAETKNSDVKLSGEINTVKEVDKTPQIVKKNTKLKLKGSVPLRTGKLVYVDLKSKRILSPVKIFDLNNTVFAKTVPNISSVSDEEINFCDLIQSNKDDSLVLMSKKSSLSKDIYKNQMSVSGSTINSGFENEGVVTLNESERTSDDKHLTVNLERHSFENKLDSKLENKVTVQNGKHKTKSINKPEVNLETKLFSNNLGNNYVLSEKSHKTKLKNKEIIILDEKEKTEEKLSEAFCEPKANYKRRLRSKSQSDLASEESEVWLESKCEEKEGYKRRLRSNSQSDVILDDSEVQLGQPNNRKLRARSQEYSSRVQNKSVRESPVFHQLDTRRKSRSSKHSISLPETTQNTIHNKELVSQRAENKINSNIGSVNTKEQIAFVEEKKVTDGKVERNVRLGSPQKRNINRKSDRISNTDSFVDLFVERKLRPRGLNRDQEKNVSRELNGKKGGSSDKPCSKEADFEVLNENYKHTVTSDNIFFSPDIQNKGSVKPGSSQKIVSEDKTSEESKDIELRTTSSCRSLRSSNISVTQNQGILESLKSPFLPRRKKSSRVLKAFVETESDSTISEYDVKNHNNQSSNILLLNYDLKKATDAKLVSETYTTPQRTPVRRNLRSTITSNDMDDYLEHGKSSKTKLIQQSSYGGDVPKVIKRKNPVPDHHNALISKAPGRRIQRVSDSLKCTKKTKTNPVYFKKNDSVLKIENTNLHRIIRDGTKNDLNHRVQKRARTSERSLKIYESLKTNEKTSMPPFPKQRDSILQLENTHLKQVYQDEDKSNEETRHLPVSYEQNDLICTIQESHVEPVFSDVNEIEGETSSTLACSEEISNYNNQNGMQELSHSVGENNIEETDTTSISCEVTKSHSKLQEDKLESLHDDDKTICNDIFTDLAETYEPESPNQLGITPITTIPSKQKLRSSPINEDHMEIDAPMKICSIEVISSTTIAENGPNLDGNLETNSTTGEYETFSLLNLSVETSTHKTITRQKLQKFAENSCNTFSSESQNSYVKLGKVCDFISTPRNTRNLRSSLQKTPEDIKQIPIETPISILEKETSSDLTTKSQSYEVCTNRNEVSGLDKTRVDVCATKTLSSPDISLDKSVSKNSLLLPQDDTNLNKIIMNSLEELSEDLSGGKYNLPTQQNRCSSFSKEKVTKLKVENILEKENNSDVTTENQSHKNGTHRNEVSGLDIQTLEVGVCDTRTSPSPDILNKSVSKNISLVSPDNIHFDSIHKNNHEELSDEKSNLTAWRSRSLCSSLKPKITKPKKKESSLTTKVSKKSHDDQGFETAVCSNIETVTADGHESESKGKTDNVVETVNQKKLKKWKSQKSQGDKSFCTTRSASQTPKKLMKIKKKSASATETVSLQINNSVAAGISEKNQQTRGKNNDGLRSEKRLKATSKCKVKKKYLQNDDSNLADTQNNKTVFKGYENGQNRQKKSAGVIKIGSNWYYRKFDKNNACIGVKMLNSTQQRSYNKKIRTFISSENTKPRRLSTKNNRSEGQNDNSVVLVNHSVDSGISEVNQEGQESLLRTNDISLGNTASPSKSQIDSEIPTLEIQENTKDIAKVDSQNDTINFPTITESQETEKMCKIYENKRNILRENGITQELRVMLKHVNKDLIKTEVESYSDPDDYPPLPQLEPFSDELKEDFKEEIILDQNGDYINVADNGNKLLQVTDKDMPKLKRKSFITKASTVESDVEKVLNSTQSLTPTVTNKEFNIPLEPGKYIKNEDIRETDFQVGSFVWAQMSRFPFWPAYVCKEPGSQDFQRIMGSIGKLFYHVRFFGDKGRRAWVYRKNVMLFCSRMDLELISNKLKTEKSVASVIKPYIVSFNMLQKWKVAVDELEVAKLKSHEDILQMFENAFEQARKLKRKSVNIDPRDCLDPIEIDTSQSNAVVLENSSAETDKDNLTGDETANNDVSEEVKFQSPSLKKSRRLTELNLVVSAPEDDTEPQSPSPRRLRRLTENKNGKPAFEEELEVQSPLSKRIRRLSENDMFKKPLVEWHLEMLSSRTRTRKQPDDVSDAGSKTSSDTTTNSSNSYSLEAQIDLFKRNNLFKGLSKDKVCQYCLEFGEIYRCKSCSGIYHYECSLLITDLNRLKKKRGRPSTGISNPDILEKPDSLEVNLIPENQGASVTKGNVNTGKTESKMSENQVQIVTITSKIHPDSTPEGALASDYQHLRLDEKIDLKMKEVMSEFENKTVYYAESTSNESNSEEDSGRSNSNDVIQPLVEEKIVSRPRAKSKSRPSLKCVPVECDSFYETPNTSTNSSPSVTSRLKEIRHVTADGIVFQNFQFSDKNESDFKCGFCSVNMDPYCFVCHLPVSKSGSDLRIKCSLYRCGKYYHKQCLKIWPQTQWSLIKSAKHRDSIEEIDSFVCPSHVCHTCASDDPRAAISRCPSDKTVKCLRCPASYHSTNYCVPAGTEILSSTQILCPRHRTRAIQPLNTTWCFICSEGGNLICCENCPTSIHPECQTVNLTDDDKFICEDCESGRLPLYDEVVWVKLGSYRWWPAVILFPNEVPDNVRLIKHQHGDFAVKFFGTNDYYWVNKTRSFLFQEGDKGHPMERSKKKIYEIFGAAIEQAALAHKFKKEFKQRMEAEAVGSLKPPPYIKIKVNKPVGNVRTMDLDLSNSTACSCDASQPHPCGLDSDCINRLLLTECDPDVCPAGKRCRNQSFDKREYAPMVAFKTQGRGWGLKSLAPIKKGQFVIEYVGEVIDSEEYQRRIVKMHEQKEENYYFLTIDKDRMIDAGPKGNLSRFMNHSCNPNCETQKWTVNGDTRVGLFAMLDIPVGSELTFNYNLECVGKEKKPCRCGAPNCSGFIGVKAKQDGIEIKRRKKCYKKKEPEKPTITSCFLCKETTSELICNNKSCNKGYHMKCLKLAEVPEASKFVCPRHNCNVCSNRTIRCCVKCTNSFCPTHAEGNVRHESLAGFLCTRHDPRRTSQKLSKHRKRNSSVADEYSVTSTTSVGEYNTKRDKRKRQSIQNMVENESDSSSKVVKTSSPDISSSVLTDSENEMSKKHCQ